MPGIGRLYPCAWAVLVPLAQELTSRLAPQPPVSQFGISMCALERARPDAGEDLIVGDPVWREAGVLRGAIYVYSGVDFELKKTRVGPIEGVSFGRSICPLQDVDGDGVGELLVSEGHSASHEGRYVWMLSGRTLETLRVHSSSDRGSRLGFAMISAGDLDKDGVCDYLLGDPGRTASSPFGMLTLVSGSTGDRIWESVAPSTAVGFGHSVAMTSDIDGDDIDDVAVGANIAGPDQGSTACISILSGKDGSTLAQRRGETGRRRFGENIASIADADGDGFRDLAIADADYRENDSSTAAWVWSGKTLATIAVLGLRGRSQTVSKPTRFANGLGRSLAQVPDMDGDGIPDISIGDDEGWVIVMSARTGKQIADSPFSFTQRPGLCQCPIDVTGSARLCLAVSCGSTICCFDEPAVWIVVVGTSNLLPVWEIRPPVPK